MNTFKSRAQVSVGAELGVSVGPIGRSIESDVTAGNKGAAHAFSYALSKGLFFGVSLEASAIAARNDVNRAFYGEKVSVSSLLNGWVLLLFFLLLLLLLLQLIISFVVFVVCYCCYY